MFCFRKNWWQKKPPPTLLKLTFSPPKIGGCQIRDPLRDFLGVEFWANNGFHRPEKPASELSGTKSMWFSKRKTASKDDLKHLGWWMFLCFTRNSYEKHQQSQASPNIDPFYLPNVATSVETEDVIQSCDSRHEKNQWQRTIKMEIGCEREMGFAIILEFQCFIEIT